jgi:putative transposase
MDDKQRLDLALFRYSLIAPLINGTLETSITDYLGTTCAKTYDVPGLGRREFVPRTLLVWRSLYQQYGLDGLKGKTRRDRGHFRRLSAEAQVFLTEALRANPRLTATALYDELATARLLGQPPCSLSTVQRFLRQVEVPQTDQPERRRFAFAHANACWQSDVCVGPYLINSKAGRKQKTNLVAILDDSSRLFVHAEFHFEANNAAFESVFKTALLKRGTPQRLYVDNGKIYHSRQIQAICAHLGIALCHATPYQPQGKGKIERAFRTLRQQLFSRLEPDDLVSLEALNQRLAHYLEQTYNNRPHSALDGKTPMERFLSDQEMIHFASKERVERAFLHEEERRVSNDATLSLRRVIFEVPQVSIGQRVRVLFRPEDLSQAWLVQEDGSHLPIAPVRLADNARIPRRRRQDPIDYTGLIKGGES